MFTISNQNLGIQKRNIKRFRNDEIASMDDFVAVEAPLQISLNNVPTSITMRTPGEDAALALGFLFSEGIIESIETITDVQQLEENLVNITIPEKFTKNVSSLDRNFYTTSSCGVCGKSSIDAIYTNIKYPLSEINFIVPQLTLLQLQEKLIGAQSAFDLTGGIHASALFSIDGTLLHLSEDVGRHNALDKLIGHYFSQNMLPLNNHILLLSGRASFELVQKAAMAGIHCILAVGAPSSLAIDLAIKNGQTLIGFLKKNSFNIYSGKERIADE